MPDPIPTRGQIVEVDFFRYSDRRLVCVFCECRWTGISSDDPECPDCRAGAFDIVQEPANDE